MHHGIDPRGVPLLDAWLRGVWLVARPLGAVPPTALTAVGAVSACAAVLVAAPRPWAALALVAAATACDALDGAVAILTGRATRLGAVADRVADRIADCAFALVIWRCGAPLWLAAAAGALSLLHEGARELLGGARRARLTVAERPTRVICAALACASAALAGTSWTAAVCAAVWTGLAAIGLVQLLRPLSPAAGRPVR